MKSAFAADAYDEIDAFGHHVVWQWRQTGDLHLFGIDIEQLAAVDFVEVMMRDSVGVEKDFAGVNNQFPYQPFFQKQLERIVDRGFGGLGVAGVDDRHYLISREVFLARK